MMKGPMHSTAFPRFTARNLMIFGISLIAAGQQPGAESPAPGTVRIHSTDKQEYVWIPAGSFEMGCVPGDSECDEDEQPRHSVTLSRGFWMGRTEVTVGAYERFAVAKGQPMPAAPDFNPGWQLKDHPIVRATWEQARTYCAWAGGRLPTEAEYEYTGRGGVEGARYPWGDTASHRYANYEGVEGPDEWQNTAPGGRFPPSKFGVYDLSGNVWEWTADWYREWYYAKSPEMDPQGPEHGVERVLRGGSWFNAPRVLRISDRFKYVVRAEDNSLGFRCVCETLP
jgi:formylglycine-generating enzyme required for sulfatase activity